MAALAIGLAAACGSIHAADALPDRWRLSDLFPSIAAWQAEAQQVEARAGDLAPCRGHLGDSARRLADCLDLNAALAERMERLSAYAALLSDEDTGLSAPLELRQRAELLSSRLDEANAFLRPELIALGRAAIERFSAEEPALRKHRQPLNVVLRGAEHTLDARGEALLATLGPVTGGGAAAYSILADAELPWPKVRLADGTEVVLDQAAYTQHRSSIDRAERQRTMQAFFGTWKSFERTFGVTIYQSLKRDAAYAKLRGYPDSLAHRLDSDNLPRAVVDMLVAQTHANLPTLHRYLRLRTRLLKLSDPGYHDAYSPLTQTRPKFPLDRSEALMLAAVRPLGEAYVSTVSGGLRAGWMDVYPRPRKRSGAYAWGAYGIHPYLLLNHNDDYESLTTLAHEWGHAMHSHLAQQTQPYVTADSATFVAEIASTLNEALLVDHLLKTARSDDERLFYLASALDNLRATFFRQAMFTEFEREAHARVDRGETLTGESLSRLYLDLLRRHHGHAAGVMRIDDLYGVEWAYIPHFYNPFYVFQYATSIAASSLLADALLSGDPGAAQRVLDLLRAGGSADPYDLVKSAGVDLASEAPYRALFARMNRLMDEIEAIEARRPR
ncbi:MAG: M3 family oligoendopeptidase [Caldimonas sp.]